MLNFLKTYLQITRTYSHLRFIVELTLLSFPFKMLLGIFWSFLGQETRSTTDAIDTNSPLDLLILACVIAPLVETWIGQWFPIWLASFFTKRFSILLWFSALFFAAQHLHVGISGFLLTFPIAVALSWSFLVKRKTSFWTAYWVTSMMHSLHNLIALSFYFSLQFN